MRSKSQPSEGRDGVGSASPRREGVASARAGSTPGACHPGASQADSGAQASREGLVVHILSWPGHELDGATLRQQSLDTLRAVLRYHVRHVVDAIEAEAGPSFLDDAEIARRVDLVLQKQVGERAKLVEVLIAAHSHPARDIVSWPLAKLQRVARRVQRRRTE